MQRDNATPYGKVQFLYVEGIKFVCLLCDFEAMVKRLQINPAKSLEQVFAVLASLYAHEQKLAFVLVDKKMLEMPQLLIDAMCQQVLQLGFQELTQQEIEKLRWKSVLSQAEDHTDYHEKNLKDWFYAKWPKHKIACILPLVLQERIDEYKLDCKEKVFLEYFDFIFKDTTISASESLIVDFYWRNKGVYVNFADITKAKQIWQQLFTELSLMRKFSKSLMKTKLLRRFHLACSPFISKLSSSVVGVFAKLYGVLDTAVEELISLLYPEPQLESTDSRTS
jgi:hypothetical protein